MSLHKYFNGKAFFNYRDNFYAGYSGIVDNLLLDEIDETHKTIAISVLDENSKSQYLVFDIDSLNSDKNILNKCLDALCTEIRKNGLIPSVIFSGNKGYHVYIFIDYPVAAFSLRMVGEYLLSSISVPTEIVIEIFPKQNTCDYTQNQYGSHLRYPYSENPKTKIFSEFKEIVENSVEDIINLELFILNKDIINGLIDSLKVFFIPGKRHNLMLGLSGYFRNNGYPISMPKYVLSELNKSIRDLDMADLTRVIDDTYNPKKERIAGFSILKSMLPYNILVVLERLIYKINDIKNLISQIRLEKTPNFQKIERCTSLLTNYLSDTYQLYEDNFIYILDKNIMYSDVNDTIKLLLHKYGISLADAFEVSVYKKLILDLSIKASKVKLKNFQFFSENQLYVLNSDCTFKVQSDNIYRSNEIYPSFNYKEFSYIPEKDRVTNIRKFFLSWGLEKEYVDTILNYIVFSIVSTEDVIKPILLLQGLPGSGKTTLASCILKLIENVNSQVNTPVSKEDDFKAMLHSRRCIVLDNLENVPAWFYDLVNSLCTNGEISQRKLYSNNTIIKTKPHVFLIVTSAYADYTDKAFNERCVKIHLSKRNEFKSLQDLMTNFYVEYNSLFSNIVDIVKEIKDVSISDNYTNRLTDFVKVGRKLYVKKYIEESWETSNFEYTSEEINDLINLLKNNGLKFGTPFYLKEYFWKIKFKYEQIIGKTYTLKMFAKDLTTCGKFEKIKNGSYKLV